MSKKVGKELIEQGRLLGMAVTVDARCTGCGACAAACPAGCILMTDNEEGFVYPSIDSGTCINCGRCVKICPLNSKETSYPASSYLFSTSDCKALARCASGGAFSEIAAAFIETGGMVIGVADDIKQGSRFLPVDNVSSLVKLSGSKYYQCNLEPSILKRINTLLGSGRQVLFCGTPCQVQAVKGAISCGLRDGLYLIDIICQGVPSRASVSEYRRQMSLRKGVSLIDHRFRAKLEGHEGQYITHLIYANGDCETLEGADDMYARSFMYQVSLRESCYCCPFASMERVGDLTLGDYWAPNIKGFFKRGSTSLVLVNSNKGKHMAAALKYKGIVKQVALEDAVRENVPLHHPVKRPRCRDYFYKLMKAFGFSAATNICCWRYPIKKIITSILRRRKS